MTDHDREGAIRHPEIFRRRVNDVENEAKRDYKRHSNRILVVAGANHAGPCNPNTGWLAVLAHGSSVPRCATVLRHVTGALVGPRALGPVAAA